MPRFDTDPTIPRIVIVALLLFIEAVLVPAYAILLTDKMPTQIQWLTFIIGGIIALVTFLGAFMKVGEEKPPSPSG